MKHLTEEDLILLYYGEPGVPYQYRMHLAECRECRSAAESLAATLEVCNEWTVPEPGAEFERRVWARVGPQISVRREARWFPVWAAAAVMAALIVIAFIAGELRAIRSLLFLQRVFPIRRAGAYSKSPWPTIWIAPPCC